jgi:hypothetical protein
MYAKYIALHHVLPTFRGLNKKLFLNTKRAPDKVINNAHYSLVAIIAFSRPSHSHVNTQK